MRQPNPTFDRRRVGPATCIALRCHERGSIAALMETTGLVDVLVKNAGIGGVGAFEAMSMPFIRQLIESNTIGVMAMTKAVIPQMRERRSCAIVNVTSRIHSVAQARSYNRAISLFEGRRGLFAGEPDANAWSTISGISCCQVSLEMPSLRGLGTSRSRLRALSSSTSLLTLI